MTSYQPKQRFLVPLANLRLLPLWPSYFYKPTVFQIINAYQHETIAQINDKQTQPWFMLELLPKSKWENKYNWSNHMQIPLRQTAYNKILPVTDTNSLSIQTCFFFLYLL